MVSDLWRQLDAFFVAVEIHFVEIRGKKAKNKILTWHINPFSTRSIMVMLEVELSKLAVETFIQSFRLQREVKADRTR